MPAGSGRVRGTQGESEQLHQPIEHERRTRELNVV